MFTGSGGALVLMTILSAVAGRALPQFLSVKYTQMASVLLFFIFGIRLLYEGSQKPHGSETTVREMKEVELELQQRFEKKEKKEKKAELRADGLGKRRSSLEGLNSLNSLNSLHVRPSSGGVEDLSETRSSVTVVDASRSPRNRSQDTISHSLPSPDNRILLSDSKADKSKLKGRDIPEFVEDLVEDLEKFGSSSAADSPNSTSQNSSPPSRDQEGEPQFQGQPGGETEGEREGEEDQEGEGEREGNGSVASPGCVTACTASTVATTVQTLAVAGSSIADSIEDLKDPRSRHSFKAKDAATGTRHPTSHSIQSRPPTRRRKSHLMPRRLRRLLPGIAEAFVLTFSAEWGDRSQIATLALGASKDFTGVNVGAISAHLICTGIAIAGGRLLATRISERALLFTGGATFLLFGAAALIF